MIDNLYFSILYILFHNLQSHLYNKKDTEIITKVFKDTNSNDEFAVISVSNIPKDNLRKMT